MKKIWKKKDRNIKRNMKHYWRRKEKSAKRMELWIRIDSDARKNGGRLKNKIQGRMEVD